MKTTTTTATATLITLALAIGTGCLPPPPPPPPPKPEPAALFTVKGQATASQALNVDVPSDLGAYLFWEGANGVFQIDEASVSGELPSSFSLDVIDAPTAAEEFSQYPGVAVAGILIAEPQVADALVKNNGTGSEDVPPNSVVGIAQVFLVHIADENAAALLKEQANIDLPVGFTLMGPNPDAQSCLDDAYAAEDNCYEHADEACDNIADPDAQESCYESIDCSAAEEQSEQAAAQCPSSTTIFDADAVISVELFNWSQPQVDDGEG